MSLLFLREVFYFPSSFYSSLIYRVVNNGPLSLVENKKISRKNRDAVTDAAGHGAFFTVPLRAVSAGVGVVGVRDSSSSLARKRSAFVSLGRATNRAAQIFRATQRRSPLLFTVRGGPGRTVGPFHPRRGP